MRIVHVNYDAGHTGGATIAAIRIHQMLLDSGVDSLFVSVLGDSTVPANRIYPGSALGRTVRWVATKTYRGFWKALGIREYPQNVVYTGMVRYINKLEPDVVHLHWVKADTISIEEIGKIKAPIVWSLHDLWSCLGINSYPENEFHKTGYNKLNTNDWVDRWTWQRKCNVFRKQRIVPVAPSMWCKREANESVVFKDHKVESVPHPVKVNVFKPMISQRARLKWGLPTDKFIVLFGANQGTKWRIKGFDRLAAALKQVEPMIKGNMLIVVFGESAEDKMVEGVPVSFVGSVTDADEMATLYPVADLFAFPSRQETFGQTKSEALACGIPVVAFDETACAEGVEHKKSGWIAKAGDIQDFANGIRWGYEIYKNREKKESVARCARESIEQLYAPQVVAEQWQALYRQIMKGK